MAVDPPPSQGSIYDLTNLAQQYPGQNAAETAWWYACYQLNTIIPQGFNSLVAVGGAFL